jgi:hypothetical protein
MFVVVDWDEKQTGRVQACVNADFVFVLKELVPHFRGAALVQVKPQPVVRESNVSGHHGERASSDQVCLVKPFHEFLLNLRKFLSAQPAVSSIVKDPVGKILSFDTTMRSPPRALSDGIVHRKIQTVLQSPSSIVLQSFQEKTELQSFHPTTCSSLHPPLEKGLPFLSAASCRFLFSDFWLFSRHGHQFALQFAKFTQFGALLLA